MTYRICGLDPARFAPLFADRRIAYIHVHSAAHGCFTAQINRHGEPEQ